MAVPVGHHFSKRFLPSTTGGAAEKSVAGSSVYRAYSEAGAASQYSEAVSGDPTGSLHVRPPTGQGFGFAGLNV
jgi:hypothetical protein